jgi:hypothetical protein
LKPGARRPRFYADKGYGQATSTNHLTLLMLGAEGEYDLKPDQRKPRPFTDLGLTFAAGTVFCDGVDPDKLSLLETFGPLREDADAAEASKWDEDERYLARREVTVVSDEIVYDENGQPRRRIRLSGGCRRSVSGRVSKVACDRQSDSAAWETHPKVVPISPRLLPLADQPKICRQKTVTVYLDMDPQLERSYLGHLYGSSTSQDNLKRARAAT